MRAGQQPRQMRAGVFGKPGAENYDSAASGLAQLGYEVIHQVPSCWRAGQADKSFDLVVVCGMRDRLGEVAGYYRAINRPVILFDLPHLRSEGGGRQLRVTPASHRWLPTFPDGEAPADRLEAIGVKTTQRKRVKGQSVLLIGQVAGDSAHGMDGGGMRRWAEETLATLRALTESKVTWRPHPRDRWMLEGADATSDPLKETLHEALEGAWAVVTFNSTAGLEALMEGVPVVACGPAVYSPLTYELRQWGRLAPPEPEELEKLLRALAYTQWTPEEIATGRPLLQALTGEYQPELAMEPEPEEQPTTDPAQATTLEGEQQPPMPLEPVVVAKPEQPAAFDHGKLDTTLEPPPAPLPAEVEVKVANEPTPPPDPGPPGPAPDEVVQPALAPQGPAAAEGAARSASVSTSTVVNSPKGSKAGKARTVRH